MKPNKKQKESIFNCLLDLEYYYANRGSIKDYENYETLLSFMRFHKIKTPKYTNVAQLKK
jgi:hypothetical protein